MTLVRWNPLAELDRIHREVNRVFDETARKGPDTGETVTRDWTPPIDVTETDERIVVSVELAGLNREDVNVDIDDMRLTVSGERAAEINEGAYRRSERLYGRFSRAFTLPDTVDVEKIVARMEQGVLEISMPKREEARPKKISVKVG